MSHRFLCSSPHHRRAAQNTPPLHRMYSPHSIKLSKAPVTLSQQLISTNFLAVTNALHSTPATQYGFCQFMAAITYFCWDVVDVRSKIMFILVVQDFRALPHFNYVCFPPSLNFVYEHSDGRRGQVCIKRSNVSVINDHNTRDR